MRKPYNPAIKHQGEYFYEETPAADENFLQVFSFPKLKGNASTALSEPYSLVLTENLEKNKKV